MKQEQYWGPFTYMTMDHLDAAANIAAVATGTIIVVKVPGSIRKGESLDRIAFLSATTPYATLTSQVFALVRAWDRLILAKTVDDGATAWGANTWKSLLLTAPYEFLDDTAVYLAMRVAATTMGTHTGAAMLSAAATGLGLPPIVAGTAGTGAIGAVGTNLPALTAIANIYTAGCS